MSKKAKIESPSKPIFVRTWGEYGTDDGQFNSAHSIAVSSNGTIYVADMNNNRIQYFDSNGNFLGKWGNKGSDDGEFNYPAGLAIGVFGEIKTESIRNAMLMVPQLTSYPWIDFNNYKSKTNKSFESKNPLGILSICISYVGVECIYVADSCNHRIQIFEVSSSSFIGKWGNYGKWDGDFIYPLSCAIGKDPLNGKSVIYVADTGNNRIQVFSSKGKFILKWGSHGNDDKGFQHPHRIAVSSAGSVPGNLPSSFEPVSNLPSSFEPVSIYIADRDNQRVICYEITHPDGLTALSNLTSIKSLKEDNKYLAVRELFNDWHPHGVMVDNDVIYVVDFDNHCVYQYKKDGRLIQSWGGEGSGDGKFRYPIGIARGMDEASGKSVIYVADTGNNRIVTMSV